MELLKWTSRTFHFGFDEAYLPFMLERLLATVPRINEMIYGIAEDKLAERTDEGWSVKQHIGHLIDLEELHEARVLQFAAGLPELRAADMTNQKTYRADHNARSAPELLQTLQEARRHFIVEIEKLPPALRARKALHSRLQQQISITDLAYFVAEHDNHHLTIMTGLLKRLL